MRYWAGVKKGTSTKVKKNVQPVATQVWAPKKTNWIVKKRLFLVLMKLWLGLTNDFFCDLFSIGKGTCSQIVNSWVRFLCRELKPLVFWPGRITVTKMLLSRLAMKYPSLSCTLDCTEVFIERPCNLELQSLTSSDYKNHNSAKYLVGIATNGMISFLSDDWGESPTKVAKGHAVAKFKKKRPIHFCTEKPHTVHGWQFKDETQNETVMQFSVLGVWPINFLDRDEVQRWGNEEIEALGKYYTKDKTHTVNNEGYTSEPYMSCSIQVLMQEMTKCKMKSCKYPQNNLFDTWEILVKLHREEFPNLVKLVYLAATYPVHISDCERIFSVQDFDFDLPSTKWRTTIKRQIFHK